MGSHHDHGVRRREGFHYTPRHGRPVGGGGRSAQFVRQDQGPGLGRRCLSADVEVSQNTCDALHLHREVTRGPLDGLIRGAIQHH